MHVDAVSSVTLAKITRDTFIDILGPLGHFHPIVQAHGQVAMSLRGRTFSGGSFCCVNSVASPLNRRVDHSASQHGGGPLKQLTVQAGVVQHSGGQPFG